MIIFKLRFRCRETKRQRVRYIGTDCGVAEAVSGELALLQRAKRRRQHLRRLEADARRLLRDTKASVQHLLADTDYHFYGLEVRGHRRRAVAAEDVQDEPSIAFEKVQ